MLETLLRDRGIDVVGYTSHGLMIGLKDYSKEILIPTSLITKYNEALPSFGEFESYSERGAVASTQYVEQALRPVGDLSARRFLSRPDESSLRSRVLRFGEESEPGACEIGRCSDLYYWLYVVPNYNLDDDDNFVVGGPATLTWVIPRPITARIRGLNSSSPQESLAKSSVILQSLLFNAAFLHDITFESTNDISRRRIRRRYRTSARVPEDSLRPPTGNYNSDLVRFYIRAIANTDPVNQFLSFYHVLEFFFTGVSDEELYSRLRSRMLTPGFRPIARSLDGLIQDVVRHKRETDETEMLKLVIKKFVDPTELSAFVVRYEEDIKEKVFSSSTSLFGEKFKANIDPQHIVGDLSRRIKAVRNALVHSSDRYERNERYIPSLQAEEMIGKEIPLLRFLAEKVIVATAVPIDG